MFNPFPHPQDFSLTKKNKNNFRPYYETRANYNGLLKVQREKIVNLEHKVSDSKMTYNEALKKLEQISEEIHKMRQDRKNYLNKLTELSSPQEREFPQKINSIDEYYDVPLKLSTKSSPIHQKSLDSHECPHLLQDFEDSLQISSSTQQTSSGIMSAEEIDQWTEIRLTNSDSTSSGYSHNDDQTNLSVSDSNSSYSDDQIQRRRFTCVGVLPDESDAKEGLSNWITRSSMKNSGRRQSLEMLIDASDKVKDVFANSFQKVGQKLERRNSESEVQSDNNSGIDFFSFSRYFIQFNFFILLKFMFKGPTRSISRMNRLKICILTVKPPAIPTYPVFKIMAAITHR